MGVGVGGEGGGAGFKSEWVLLKELVIYVIYVLLCMLHNIFNVTLREQFRLSLSGYIGYVTQHTYRAAFIISHLTPIPKL